MQGAFEDSPPAGAGPFDLVQLPDDRRQIEDSGRFDRRSCGSFAWEVSYDAGTHLDLLDTFSTHIAMEPWQRDRLHAEIRSRLRERPDGRPPRGWGAVLHVARRRDVPTAA